METDELMSRVTRATKALVRGALAEDVAQEVWMRCTVHGYGPEVPFVVLKHMIVDELRKERRYEGPRFGEVEIELPERVDEAESERCKVHEAIDQAELSWLETKVVMLRFWWGLPVAEIALQCKQTVEATAIAMGTAMFKIRTAMQSIAKEV